MPAYRIGERWSEYEDWVIRTRGPQSDARTLAQMLGRTESAIYQRAAELKVSLRPWYEPPIPNPFE